MALNLQALRSAFGRFPTGVTIVTTLCDGKPLGFTANSFTSVSMNPPMLLVCPGKHLSSFQAFAQCDYFAVNILAEGQEALATHFASFKGDRFADTAWQLKEDKAPFIEQAAARFLCQAKPVIDAGDHIILLGEILDFDQSHARGLGFLSGQYFSLSLEAQASNMAARKLLAGVILEHQGQVILEKGQDGYALPLIEISHRQGQREQLMRALSSKGIEAEIGRVYSLFENAQTGENYCFFHGRAQSFGSNSHAIPIDQLGALRYSKKTDASILERFEKEYQHRNFGLYIGDDISGDLHKLDQD